MKEPREISQTPLAQSPLFYQNPLPISGIGDPFVLRAADGQYYLFATSAPNGYYCWRSADLVHWTDRKMAYTRQSGSWAAESFWAPEVVAYRDRYYMFYTAKGAPHSLRIGVAVSEQPDGPYLDALEGPLFDLGYAAIDANVFIDDDGRAYLYFSKDCSENLVEAVPTSQIYGAELAEDLLSLRSEPVLLTTPDQRWEKASVSPLWNEGPELLKHGGRYYLTYSGNCFAGRSYSVGYAVSEGPLGPFTKAEENPILTGGSYEGISGPGHHSFVTSPDGSELFLVYHTHTFPDQGGGNRQVNLDRLRFTEDGRLYADGPTLSPQPVPASEESRNCAPEGTIRSGPSTLPQLSDGMFSVHKKDADLDWVQAVGEDGTVTVTVTLPDPRSLTGVCLYRGAPGGPDFGRADLLLDGDRSISGLLCPEDLWERAAAAAFPPERARTVTVLLTPREGEREVSLSEIVLLTGGESPKDPA